MHRAIAAKLRCGLEPIEIAIRNLDRWAPSANHSAPYLEQWRKILALPVEEIAALLEEDSERMAALRQASPFAGVLSPQERWSIYDTFAIGTYHPGSGDHIG